MNWEDQESLKVAALRLLLTAQLARSKACAGMVDELDDLGILSTTSRRDLFALVPSRLPDFERYLAARWPDYRTVAGIIQANDQSIDIATLRSLRRRHLEAPGGFPVLNRKTWSAWAGAHSKSRAQDHPDAMSITIDDTVRARVNRGLRMRHPGGEELDLELQQQMLTEIAFPDRCLVQDWEFCGALPSLFLTVENIGAFVDIKKPDNCLLVHSPGWNTPNVLRLRARLPVSVPWRHFGDLDPNGLRIAASLVAAAATDSDAGLWIPAASASILDSHSLPLHRAWKEDSLPSTLRAHPTLSWLIDRGRWLEQEAIVLLPEFSQELTALAR